MQRKWKQTFVAVALLTLLGQAPAFAARIVVGGQCTLARAIIAANSDSTAGGVCRRGLGADNIVLPRNRPQVLTRIDNISYGPTGLPVIRSNIRISGNGNVISRIAPARFRIFAVARNGRLFLNRLTIRGGSAVRHRRGSGGGGIRSVGILVTIRVTFDGNNAVNGSGGGIWAQNVLIIIQNRFRFNRSFCTLFPSARICQDTNGGGTFYGTGPLPISSLQPTPTLSVTGTTFSGNTANGTGGGLMVCGEATVANSLFADNAASQGGGLSLDDAFTDVTLTNTTLTDNIAAQSGGGIFVEDESLLTLNNTVVSGNTAPQGPEIVALPEASVETDNANTIGFGGNAGIVGFTLGPSDTIAAQPPRDPTVEELPPVAQLPIQEPPPAEEPPPPAQPAPPPPSDEAPSEEAPPTTEPPADEAPSPGELPPPPE